MLTNPRSIEDLLNRLLGGQGVVGDGRRGGPGGDPDKNPIPNQGGKTIPDPSKGGGGAGGMHHRALPFEWTWQNPIQGTPNLLGIEDLLNNPNFHNLWDSYNVALNPDDAYSQFWGMPFNKLITGTGGGSFIWGDKRGIAPLLPGYEPGKWLKDLLGKLNRGFKPGGGAAPEKPPPPDKPPRPDGGRKRKPPSGKPGPYTD